MVKGLNGEHAKILPKRLMRKDREDRAPCGLIALGSRFDAAWFQEQGGDSSGFPVFIGHGERESEQSVAGAEAARDYLQTAGYDVTFRTFDVGHAVPSEMVDAIIEWLKAH